MWRTEMMPMPNKVGIAGKAWAVDFVALRRKLGVADAMDATVAAWIVEAPWAHPVWHSYAVILVHLRPMPDGRQTLIYRPGATHEFWVYALNPEEPRAPQVLGEGKFELLRPVNFAAQLIETSDEAAKTKVEAAVDLITRGELNPDTDAFSSWVAVFGGDMVKQGYR